MTQARVGQYFYGRHRGQFGVWVYTHVSEDGSASCGQFVRDFHAREDARTFVWEMNGWGTPKTALSR
ncbi:MAG: hypothetical protein IAB99_03405 [Bacteroidetes bacterium]|uniref:Uncharacterized protein n=1 Tax=Candidatus Cryptobacteroides faecipullorum TaxID=2840764 RepID=A0A9D9I6F6_9BACT|nr:hypothetical protein [Candidatus Cryptobacteroides faecipullorum]